MINCVILAGNSDKQLLSKDNKAFIDLNSKPMITYVLDALRRSEVVGKIAVVGPREELIKLGSFIDIIIDDDGSMLNNLLVGVKHFQDDNMLLISTCDIPFITGDAVSDFVKKALELNADVCYPIIEKNNCQLKYPDAKRTYASLKEGKFTGGNLFVLNPAIIDRCVKIAKQMIEYRKSPTKMSRVLGLPFLIKLVSGRLTIREVENRISKLLSIYGKAIISEYAEIGNDVDKPEDIEIAEKYLAIEKA